MNKVEKIKAEIKKRYKDNQADGYTDVCEELFDLCTFIDSLEEEPISNDLEEAAYQYGNCFDNHFELASMSFIKGAQWQKKHLFDNRIKDCNNITEDQYNLESDFVDDFIDKHDRMPTFLDAIEYGINYKKE